MGSLLEIKNLSVAYKTRRGLVSAVEDVSLNLDKGRSLGLVGESGSGKSTIGTAILGMLPDNATAQGNIRFGNLDLLNASADQAG